jgi:cobalt/nickel transport system permease protein
MDARVDARVKLAAATGGWLVALAARRPAGPLVVAALALVVLATIRRLPALRRLAPALLAGAVAAGLQAFLAPTADRMQGAALLLARVVACGAVGAALAAATPFAELLAALSWARVPAPLLDLLALAQRQRHALAEGAWRIRDAQRLRLGWVGWRRSVRSAGALVGAASYRAIAQAEIMADALALRGAAGPLVPSPLPPARSRDAAVAAAAAVALAACAILVGGLSP